mgnify:CR=1 FL=1
MTSVKDLIKELQQLDPDSIVLYAYDEYGNTGTHSFIDDEEQYLIINKDGSILEYDREIITFENNYKEEKIDEVIELIDSSLKDGGKQVRCIKLFA